MAGLSDLLQSGSLAYSNPTPSSVAARRALAEQLLRGSQNTSMSPLGALAQTLGGSFSGYENKQAINDEAMGQQGASSALAEALKGDPSFESLSSVVSNPWLNQGQSGLVSTLLGQEIQQADPMYKLDLGLKEAQLAAAQAPATPDLPAGVEEYQFAVSQGYPGSYEQWKTDMAKAGATNIDFNQNQGTAAGFADRMASANSILSDPALLPAMTDPTKPALAGVPVAGNYMVGPEFQMAEQAQRDFVNAILRRESGAVISPSEFDNAKKQYFPQPGDSPEVIAQKAQNRQIAIEGVMRAAGPNYQQPPSMSAPAPSGDVVDYTTYFGGQ